MEEQLSLRRRHREFFACLECSRFATHLASDLKYHGACLFLCLLLSVAFICCAFVVVLLFSALTGSLCIKAALVLFGSLIQTRCSVHSLHCDLFCSLLHHARISVAGKWCFSVSVRFPIFSGESQGMQEAVACSIVCMYVFVYDVYNRHVCTSCCIFMRADIPKRDQSLAIKLQAFSSVNLFTSVREDDEISLFLTNLYSESTFLRYAYIPWCVVHIIPCRWTLPSPILQWLQVGLLSKKLTTSAATTLQIGKCAVQFSVHDLD